MSDPFGYILDNPELFNEDLRRMATFQRFLGSDQFNVWGDLPGMLDQNAKGAQSLREKSERSDELAEIILKANPATMKCLATDATFDEKKALFQALAALPVDNRGMAAIEETIEETIDWSFSGPQGRFDRDLQRVMSKVEEANAALREFDAEYSTLFLSVRKVSMLARAARGGEVDDDEVKSQSERVVTSRW